MSTKKLLALFFLLNYVLCSPTSAKIHFTNVVCTPLDPNFALFDYCYLKAVNRSYSYMSLKVRLLQLPITNVTVHFSLLKRANGYKPFLYNVSADACKSLRKNNINPVVRFIYDCFRQVSNMNHSCPYDHDLIVEKLDADFLNNRLTNLLPMPKGDFAFDSNWLAYSKNRANVKLFWTIS